MRAWRFHDFGSIENLIQEEVDMPSPGPGEVLLKLNFAALNPADHFLIKGQYPRPGTPPFSVGRDGSATVVQVQADSRFSEGDTVVVLCSDLGVARTGTLAEYVCCHEESLALLPEGWSEEEGAAAPLVFLTAWQALVMRGRLKAGETVLINGASGGVGSAAIMLAKAMGARVIALSGSEEKWPALRDIGADIVADSRSKFLEKEVKGALDGGRVDLVIENLGGPFLQKSISMVGLNGRICVIGLLAGFQSEITVGHLIFKCIEIHGLNVGAYTPAESQAAWTQIVETLDGAKRRPVIDTVFPMNKVQEAFAKLGEGPLGKVLVNCQS